MALAPKYKLMKEGQTIPNNMDKPPGSEVKFVNVYPLKNNKDPSRTTAQLETGGGRRWGEGGGKSGVLLFTDENTSSRARPKRGGC